jgi:lipid-binding SYLF domain-containing protein
MRHSLLSVAQLLVGMAAVLPGCRDLATDRASPQAQENEQQQLVDKARIAVVALRSNKALGSSVNETLDGAWGVLIFPNLFRAGFVVGGAGGVGVLLGRAVGGWSDPAFYFTGEGSFGLQIGAEAVQIIFVIRNKGALEKIMNGSVNLGGDLSVAIGPIGGGVAGATTPNMRSDLVAFSVQQGIFGGVAFTGGVISPLTAWNEVYYGTGATPRTIIIEKRFHNPGTDALKAALR